MIKKNSSYIAYVENEDQLKRVNTLKIDKRINNNNNGNNE